MPSPTYLKRGDNVHFGTLNEAFSKLQAYENAAAQLEDSDTLCHEMLCINVSEVDNRYYVAISYGFTHDFRTFFHQGIKRAFIRKVNDYEYRLELA